MVHVRMDTEMKRKATKALAAMGLTASEAVRLLFHRIAVEQAFPLELKVPNAENTRSHGRSRRDGQHARGTIRERGRDVCGA